MATTAPIVFLWTEGQNIKSLPKLARFDGGMIKIPEKIPGIETLPQTQKV
jgi:hypothetical protein